MPTVPSGIPFQYATVNGMFFRLKASGIKQDTAAATVIWEEIGGYDLCKATRNNFVCPSPGFTIQMLENKLMAFNYSSEHVWRLFVEDRQAYQTLWNGEDEGLF